jgi:dTDP-6-deoxy-L-talose 4-dehydrogenase (NAD+)
MVDGALDERREPAPANPYGFAKVALWRQLEYLKAVTPFDLTWARLFYTWGDGQARTSLYPLLRAAAERGDATFPMSAGEQLRDYLPVADVAAILAELAALRADAGVVNVSSGVPTSIRSLVERWIAEHGWAIRPEFGHRPYPTYEPLAFWGCAAKRRALLPVG